MIIVNAKPDILTMESTFNAKIAIILALLVMIQLNVQSAIVYFIDIWIMVNAYAPNGSMMILPINNVELAILHVFPATIAFKHHVLPVIVISIDNYHWIAGAFVQTDIIN